MGSIPWDVVLAAVGIAIPIIAFVWEFTFIGRKRLGYRVQMDARATDEVRSAFPGVVEQFQRVTGEPSFILLRVENNGWAPINGSDYAVLDHDNVGIRVSFPGRRIIGKSVTELSDSYLRDSFMPRQSNPDPANPGGTHSGFGVTPEGVLTLPRVAMNVRQHYKVMLLLDSLPGGPRADGGGFLPPEVDGGIKGGFPRRKRGAIQEAGGTIFQTRSGRRWSPPALAMIGALTAILVVLVVLAALREQPPPVDCAKGRITIVGSTAFKPVLEKATRLYGERCPYAAFDLDLQGSRVGLVKLRTEAGGKKIRRDEMVAFSDVAASSREFPELAPRPVAFAVYTLVAHPDVPVATLDLARVRDIFLGRGTITNWRELNEDARDLPIRVVSRQGESGTRIAFEKRVLRGPQPSRNSDDCEEPEFAGSHGIMRCERGGTGALLDAVARVPGAIGYSEVTEATARGKAVKLILIDGKPATVQAAAENAYPYGDTEYAYTYGTPAAGSLAAGLLRFMTEQAGQEAVRSGTTRPCADLDKPVSCRP